MSKARLVITAVVVEGRSQAEVARDYGVSQGWVSKLVARYRAEGDAAFEPRSRATEDITDSDRRATVELIVDLRRRLTARVSTPGADTIGWHLEHHHHIRVSERRSTGSCAVPGWSPPQPQKRPRSSYVRFAAEQPNETWQADFTHYRLANGVDVEILYLARRPRPLRPVRHRPPPRHRPASSSPPSAHAIDQHGLPASTLTDNGMVFTTRFVRRQRRPQRLRDRTASASASSRRTRDRTTRPPAARSNASNRP